ncbi:acyl carrier protein isoform X2 [Linepithema humile]|uniref:acyl carrier protein isoform X2 n=1 Tax=Linepithema humile TaxID=83485 RepID=UPI000623B3D3|nr:PREDICTED: acyl carrier protein, mitochondrial isoform X2 [Linepithema humile]
MASLAGVRLLARSAGGFRNTLGGRLRCATTAFVQMRCCEQRLLHCTARTTLVAPQIRCKRGYCEKVKAKPGSVKDIEQRVLKAVAAYNEVTAEKLTLESHFLDDLGLDSLDHVEIIMAIEDEFGFEIPDMDAERLLKPKDIVRYVADKEDIYE